MLEQDALRYYFKQTKVIERKPVKVAAGHFVLIFRHNGDILFHAQSVITLCHIAQPDVFDKLTSSSMRMAFPRHQRLMSDGCNMSFRALKEDEFWEIVK